MDSIRSVRRPHGPRRRLPTDLHVNRVVEELGQRELQKEVQKEVESAGGRGCMSDAAWQRGASVGAGRPGLCLSRTWRRRFSSMLDRMRRGAPSSRSSRSWRLISTPCSSRPSVWVLALALRLIRSSFTDAGSRNLLRTGFSRWMVQPFIADAMGAGGRCDDVYRGSGSWKGAR